MAIRSPLRYPGGKRKALPLILPLIPDGIEDWREPFFGGGSVTLGYIQSNIYTAKRLIVGDLSPEIWAFWQGVKIGADEVASIAKKWVIENVPLKFKLEQMYESDDDYESVFKDAIEEAKEFWKLLTTIDCNNLSLLERAARTFIVNQISFSGMGDSGTLSKEKFIEFKLSDVNKMLDVSPLLQKIEILHASFEETMADVDKDKSFIFLDPPYIAQEKSGLYGKGGDTHFGFPHKELADLCKKTECKWLMTLDDSVKARRLYRWANIEPFKLSYTMGGKTAEDALAGEEIFIANYNIGSDASYDDIDSLV